ncbi:UPF0489 domain-containing protein [Dehalogenimonas formicexedens]|uniref:UPF0489 domain-containing protein n=1 Tax=Dehalogenimonas formicexedens TaxID=1839801 RepID=A0A1P8F991_9CHLR|nr:UPF0489 family protein [Dehalogenimonas formicexedens]APV45018.1 UPF0489 domain-containing protein [Dehalogenimonas formicexedens]
MRCLDIDLDFFLNRNAYYSGAETRRLGEEYRPWTGPRVEHFLEVRCGLSPQTPVMGRVIESHDLVLSFWQALIDSGDLKIPFDVIHVDAHPDLSVRGGLRLVSNRLYIDPAERSAFIEDYVHSGNYLTFAIAMGWIGSLVWIPLLVPPKRLHKADQASNIREAGIAEESSGHFLRRGLGIPFKTLSRHNFKTRKSFDCMILSRSLAFTPPASDDLIPLISSYMKIV